MPPTSPSQIALDYHERTKHLPGRFARSLGYMDWDTQPDPFRRFAGAELLPLDQIAIGDLPAYEPAFLEGRLPAPPHVSTRQVISQLLLDSLALSAWKQAGNSRWALRVNPSSGNLHPTEGYVVAGPVRDFNTEPAIYHYAPREHGLERRAALSVASWAKLAARLPEDSLLIGLTSIAWRESWKYGERAFRYCQHDLGHAIGAIAIAAAGMGLSAHLLDRVLDEDLAALLGIDRQSGIEAERAECLLAIHRPMESAARQAHEFTIPPDVIAELRGANWHGEPNSLSSGHHLWPEIEEVSEATRKTAAAGPIHEEPLPEPIENPALTIGDSPISLRRILHQRRSALGFDGHTGITRDAFVQILTKTLPGRAQVPFQSWPHLPRIDLLLFVHRVAEVTPGLYALVRHPSRIESLRKVLDPGFAWRSPEGIPPSLPLYLLEAGDARKAAVQTSCGQDFAGEGVLAAAMLADYEALIESFGAWMYRRLFWEAGLVGQVLYLEAEASGIRGSGIGCYFDDGTHRIFGVRDRRHQVLYHFTMGGPVDDPRLQTLPAY